jgi:hypothetical protein
MSLGGDVALRVRRNQTVIPQARISRRRGAVTGAALGVTAFLLLQLPDHFEEPIWDVGLCAGVAIFWARYGRRSVNRGRRPRWYLSLGLLVLACLCLIGLSYVISNRYAFTAAAGVLLIAWAEAEDRLAQRRESGN